MKIKVHMDEIHNKVTKDYRKLVVNNSAILRMISGFRCNVNEIFTLLGCYAV
jgi:hypothetical protein